MLLEVSAKGRGVVGVVAGAAPPLLAGAGLGGPPHPRTHFCVVGHCHPEPPGGRGAEGSGGHGGNGSRERVVQSNSRVARHLCRGRCHLVQGEGQLHRARRASVKPA